MTKHPLIVWYAGLMKADAARLEGTDIVLGDLGGKRFAVGIDADGGPLLCCLEGDKRAMTSVAWTGAAMVFDHKDRDWVVLSCADVRVAGSEAMESVPLRIWIPVTLGRLLAWKDHRPDKLTISEMMSKQNGPLTAGTTIATIPMKIIG